jgi:cell wall-associated NlpC family hydrolase
MVAATLLTVSVPAAHATDDAATDAGVSKSAVATKKKASTRDLMPGYRIRARDPLSVNAVAALTLIMRQDNVDDPVYRAARKLVSDEVASRMGLDAKLLDRKWNKAPRDHQIAGLAAISQIGVKYVEGKEDPYVQMDCSGLQWFAWRTAGLDMPRQAVSQMDTHMRIERKDALLGDMVGEGTHVHMYLGLGNAMIHAPFNGKRVKFKMMSEAQAQRTVWADPSRIVQFRL